MASSVRTMEANPVQFNNHIDDPLIQFVDNDNLMVQHYNSTSCRTYDDGPGRHLSYEANSANNLSPVGIYLKNVSKMLDANGIRNICKRFGKLNSVNPVKVFEYDEANSALVFFVTQADAAEAIREITSLRLEHNGQFMSAQFKRPKGATYTNNLSAEEAPNEENAADLPDDSEELDRIPHDFDLPFGTPLSLNPFAPEELISSSDCAEFKMLREYYYKREELLLDESLHNRKRTTSTEETFSIGTGSFDEQKQQFVNDRTTELSTANKCKNCRNLTIQFCKNCEYHFCSSRCWKEFGCGCVDRENDRIVEQKPKRRVMGRGAMLILPESSSPAESSCAPTSMRQRIMMLKKHCQNEESVSGIVEPCALPLNEKLVLITTVVSHNVVFLRSVKNDNAYLKYVNDVAEYTKTAATLTDMPKKGDIVATEYDGCYHRALVARILNGDQVLVALLELGKLEKRSISSLKVLRQDLQFVGRFIFKAQLSGVIAGLKNDECLTYLMKLMDDGIQLRFVLKEDLSEDVQCELIDTTSRSVNETLNALNNIRLGELVMVEDIPVKKIDSNDPDLVIIDKSLAEHGICTVVPREHLPKMFLMHQRIQEYCKDEYESPYMSRPNEICLVKHNDQWYRAEREASFGNKRPVMLFIDFAVYNAVHVNNIRQMPWEFRFPRYSHDADLDGTQKNLAVNVENATKPKATRRDLIKKLMKLSLDAHK